MVFKGVVLCRDSDSRAFCVVYVKGGEERGLIQVGPA